MNLFSPALLKIILLVVMILFTLCMLFIFLYSIAQAQLVRRYLQSKKRGCNEITNYYEPSVTIQLPMYNEMYVAERLIEKVLEMQYPKDKLQIQVIDDSTDETVKIVAAKVEEAQKNGFNIVHVRRTLRTGFKAGALKDAMESASGEFIAIFDADFLPESTFLKQTLSHFLNDKVGVVQSCWTHINRNYSILTQLQAFGLDAHFTIEQVGRNSGGSFINFNGTAGVWRKQCIIDAGNWEADTLTEDLDLSYRAQIKGWQFVYLEDVKSPAELPPVMSALKSQQYRWTKGGAEVAKKMLWKVMRAPLSLSVKWHAFFHLMNSSVFITVILSALLSVPILMLKQALPEFKEMLNWVSIFLFSFIIVGVLYFVASLSVMKNKKEGMSYFLKHFPLFLAVSMGLSLHNAIAVIEGFCGKKTPFIRTPKFNVVTSNELWQGNKYLQLNINFLTITEGILALYFLFGIVYGIFHFDYSLLLFHFMLFVGFSFVFYFSVFQSKIKI